ncbi:[Pyruvate dehydrogenase [acetyl-transferring]]-phosphatase 1, mitochondrial [Coemansia sp. S146]|nr:[Pyruvate dehydrogenase [acetyl-transferring]]-phosphatase 1, mitochondrial [Coemansia sp. S146]
MFAQYFVGMLPAARNKAPTLTLNRVSSSFNSFAGGVLRKQLVSVRAFSGSQRNAQSHKGGAPRPSTFLSGKLRMALAIGSGGIALAGYTLSQYLNDQASKEVEADDSVPLSPTLAALKSIELKHQASKTVLDGLEGQEQHHKAVSLDELSDDEVDALLQAKENAWCIESQFSKAKLQVSTSQISSNNHCEDYLTYSDLTTTQASEKGNESGLHMFGIFDGHNAKCHEIIAQNQDLQKLHEVQYGLSGSGGLVAIVDTNDKEIVVGNAGDSRALVGVLQDDGTWKAVRLTDDQTSVRVLEYVRVMGEHPGEDNAIQGGRVLGSLRHARAFGDIKYKWPLDVQKDIFPSLNNLGYHSVQAPEHCITPPYVTSYPVLRRHKLSSNDKFVVLASGGLYDKLSNDQVIETVAKWYEANNANKKESAGSLAVKDSNASTHLIRAALSIDWHGTQGNSTVRRLLAIPSPHSRQYHNDISVTVVTLDIE